MGLCISTTVESEMTTNETFTKKQIEAAAIKLWPSAGKASADQIIAELTKPVWKPAVGEVSAYTNKNGDVKYGIFQPPKPGFIDKMHPLTPDEVPALKVAIKALAALSLIGNSGVVGNSDGNVVASQALARIKELTGG